MPELPARSHPFDPGYDTSTLAAHVAQSRRLIATVKLSMGTWALVEDSALRAKVDAVRLAGLPVLFGGSMFEICADRGVLVTYFELCRELGVAVVECGDGFGRRTHHPVETVDLAAAYGLTLCYELGRKHGGRFTDGELDELVALGRCWLDAGATHLVVEARESARDVGLFDADGRLDQKQADVLAEAFGPDRVVFEAPTKASQFALLDHLGPEVGLGNIRFEELLRVESYRRGLHGDSYQRMLGDRPVG